MVRHLIGGGRLEALIRLVRSRLIRIGKLGRHTDPGRLLRLGKLVGSIFTCKFPEDCFMGITPRRINFTITRTLVLLKTI